MKYINTGMVYDIRDVISIRELLDTSCELFAENTAFLFREGEEVREITYSELYRDARALATYLNSLGLEGQKIAVTGKNSYGWALAYLAVCAGTGIIIPMDKGLRSDEMAYVLKDSGAAAVIYSADTAAQVENAGSGCMLLPMGKLAEYLSRGSDLIAAGDRSYQNHRVDPFALGVLLYTSGTTGVAKGVMLSQNNICSDLVHVLRRVWLSSEDRCLSVLPLHHTYECLAGFLAFLFAGASIAYNDSLRRLQADFLLFRPTVFVTVPLVLENFRKMIRKKYANIKGGGLVLAAQKMLAGGPRRRNEALKRVIFRSVNESFGGRLRALLCGAAPLAKETFEEFERFGFQVYIGYGLTETSPVCIMHHDGYRNAGDIGFPLTGLSVRLDHQNEEGIGELVVKGPNVMLGYYNNPEATAEVLQDGWFRTGDLARINGNGAYEIMGRVKSMIVLPGGKKVFPEELEKFLAEYPVVKECLVYYEEGAVTASVYPDDDAVRSALADAGKPENDENVSLCRQQMIKEAVKAVNAQFPDYKSIRSVRIRENEFLKTTTQKIKRFEPENIEGGEKL